LQEKFKHADVVGVEGNFNKENAQKFIDALRLHVENPDVLQIIGTYRGDAVIHYYDLTTNINVMTDLDGAFKSVWELNSDQQENLKQRGSL